MDNQNSIERLKKIGFKKVGKWIKSKKKQKRIDFCIDNHSRDSDLIYAFESNDTVYYIGKTDSTLSSRMDNYKAGKEDGKAGKTNKVVHNKLLDLLNDDREVNIYILLEKLNDEFHGFKISLASGIELSLIGAFDSNILWNSRGTGKANDKNKKNSIEPPDLNKKDKDVLTSNSFELVLGKEYYEKGIISFPIRFKDLLPQASGVRVNLRYGNNRITATYTVSGNTRKVNGKKELTNWFKNFKQGDSIKVQIESTNEFVLTNI